MTGIVDWAAARARMILAFVAIVLAMINVVGGFTVTNRMLNMIAGRNKRT